MEYRGGLSFEASDRRSSRDDGMKAEEIPPVGPSNDAPQGLTRDSRGSAVASRAFKKRKRLPGKAWTFEEKSIIVEGLKNGLSSKQIHEKSLLPNRTLVAIMLRATSLKNNNNDLNAQPDQLHVTMDSSNDFPQVTKVDFGSGTVTPVATKKQKQGQWTEEEKSVVNMGRMKGLSYKAIHGMLPNRSIKAIVSQAKLLIRDNYAASESAEDSINPVRPVSKRKSVDPSMERTREGLPENSDFEPIRPHRAGDVFQEFICKEFERSADDKEDRDIEGSDWDAEPVQPQNLLNSSNGDPQAISADFGCGAVTPAATKKQKQGQWTEEEKSVVNIGRLQGLSYKAIHDMLPNRSIKAIASQATLLRRDNHTASASAAETVNAGGPVSKRKSVDRSMEGEGDGLAENSDIEPVRPRRTGEVFQNFIKEELERLAYDKKGREIEGSDLGAEPVQPQNLLNPSNDAPQVPQVRIAVFGGESVTPVAAKKRRKGQIANKWTEEEKCIVNMGCLKGLSYKAIHDMLPHRSIKAIALQATLHVRGNYAASASAADTINTGGYGSKRKSVDRSMEGEGDGLAENSDIEPVRPRRTGEVFQNFIKEELERLAYDKKGREIEGSDLGAEPVQPQNLLNPSNDAPQVPQVRIAVFGGESVTPVAAKKQRKGKAANKWTEEEKCIVNMGCLKGLSYKAIHGMLPHRSIKAIALQAKLLIKDNHAENESAADTVNPVKPGSKRKAVDRSTKGRGEGLPENSDLEPIRPRRAGEVFQQYINKELERLTAGKAERKIEGSDWVAEPVQPQILLNPLNSDPQLISAEFEDGTVTHVATKKQRKGQAEKKWTEEEKSIIYMARLQGLSFRAIHDILPNRSIRAIALQATLLIRNNYTASETATDTFYPLKPVSKNKPLVRSIEGPCKSLPESSVIEPIRPSRAEVFQEIINEELERLTVDKEGMDIESSDWSTQPVPFQNYLNPSNSDPQEISADFEGGTITFVATKQQNKVKTARNFDDQSGQPQNTVEDSNNAPQLMQAAVGGNFEALKMPSPEELAQYVEETSWRYNNNSIPESGDPNTFRELLPLAPPAPLPPFPQTGDCVWTFNEQSRVLLGSFRKEGECTTVNDEDREFLFDMMERNDVTVITEGNADELDPDIWSLEFIKKSVGAKYHHKFRRFTALSPNHPTDYQEVDGYLVMKISDYFEFLAKREMVMVKLDSGESIDQDLTYVYLDADDQQKSLNLLNDVVYMIDYDMVKMLPEHNDDLMSKMKLPEFLPGGRKCMMNAINQNGRPFMGPNLYMTPGGSFTAVHQDGFGTVDSGHLCLSGFNEVVMLRRMPENHKGNALRLLYGETSYDPLHELPHGDLLGTKPKWPTKLGIELCRKMNYCPSVFILSAGQQVHINKGRLHAFRKLTPGDVAGNDCHKDLRLDIISNTSREILFKNCISVAWDWMYLGNSSEGINREVVSILECTAINRVFGKMSLAIPELAILELARKHSSLLMSKISNDTFLAFKRASCAKQAGDSTMILAGILPALQVVVGQHVDITQETIKKELKGVKIAKRPNSWENPQLFALDPYGNSDFFCKLCSCELSNLYMHCDGCENLLFKDFNICVQCHAERKYAVKVAMHPCNHEKRHCAINHVGNMVHTRQKRCPCKNGPACSFCSYCLGCSCTCHTSFTLHQRLLNSHDELELCILTTAIVGDKKLRYADEVAPRLKAAIQSATNKLTAQNIKISSQAKLSS